MNLKNFVRLFGVLDIALIGWLAISAILRGKIPFYTDLIESLAAAKAFGGVSSTLLAIAPYILVGSLIFSGVLLLLHNKMGAYLALAQSPFRCIWVIQPSFFFIALVKGVGVIYWVQLGVVFALEIFKAVVLILWLKQQRKPALQAGHESAQA